jgi:DNA-binding NarL/FixJ family response regulator
MREYAPTERELQALLDAARGLTVEQSARRRFVSRSAVNRRLEAVREKLDAVDTKNAVHKAWELGLFPYNEE